MKKILSNILRGAAPFIFVFASFVIPAYSLTINEVARELACPCECPLVLEDCNMSCGLGWKKEIGEKIKAGLAKEQIVSDFVAKHGHASKITPMQRVHGKFFQYTRAFGTVQWVVFWSVIVIWAGALFSGVFLLIRRLAKRKASKADMA